MTTIAVTGGAGHFGRVVVAHLERRGYRVRSLDRIAQSSSHRTRLAQHTLDLRNMSALQEAMRGCDGIVHLAAIPGLGNGLPDDEVYANNTTISYNVLYAAGVLGIKKVCLASSVNAIGGAFGRAAHYQYFPVDEAHPNFNEDAYSLSKWVMEQQADSIARRYEEMTIVSLRFHALTPHDPERTDTIDELNAPVTRTLWGFTNVHAAARACERALRARCVGHHVFFIVAPRTFCRTPSLELARRHYPDVPVRGDLSDNVGFYDCSKAERMLGWKHDE